MQKIGHAWKGYLLNVANMWDQMSITLYLASLELTVVRFISGLDSIAFARSDARMSLFSRCKALISTINCDQHTV